MTRRHAVWRRLKRPEPVARVCHLGAFLPSPLNVGMVHRRMVHRPTEGCRSEACGIGEGACEQAMTSASSGGETTAPSVSVILPCLNEEASVALCVKEAFAAMAAARIPGE